jgi:hypothetical protein
LAFEPIHALVYFAAEPPERFATLGLKGWWMGYFASRAAPMGPVAAGVVTATFHGFAPSMVERAIPDAWSLAAPEAVHAARLDGIDAALRRVLGAAVDDPALATAASSAREICDAASVGGRPIFAALRGLPWPDEPHLALWHAATLLREHRGDGHIAALTAAGIDGCQSQVLQVARGATTRDDLQRTRGWTDADWVSAEQRLEAAFGDRATQVREHVEQVTDDLASEPLAVVGPDHVDHLLALIEPIADTVESSAEIRYPNPIGLPHRNSTQ